MEYFRQRLLALIAASKTPVEWVVIDASSVNVVDSMAIDGIDRLSEELAARGIVLVSANLKRSLGRRFQGAWIDARRELTSDRVYPTLKSAIRAFQQRRASAGEENSGSVTPT